MRKKLRIGLIMACVAVVIALLVWYLHDHTVATLQPRGVLGQKERGLMELAIILSVIVVIPVFALTIAIMWKYREGNTSAKKKYEPDWDHSRLFESIWWGIPMAIILILSIVTWNSSHALDPYRALASDKKPLVVQVVALDWKWLFIYPEQHIASVNLAEIPVNTPVEFQVTSDTVMNSFWVPQLGGQIYAMPGMVTQLHEQATHTGDFLGSPANIAGEGFSRMDFTIRAATTNDFDTWIQRAGQSSLRLDGSTYATLAKPSWSNPVAYASDVQPGLFNTIVMKYMMPGMDHGTGGAH